MRLELFHFRADGTAVIATTGVSPLRQRSPHEPDRSDGHNGEGEIRLKVRRHVSIRESRGYSRNPEFKIVFSRG
jgi:hypothetical protein